MSEPTQPVDGGELALAVEQILENCVSDCADSILMFDSDDYAGKEARKYRNQLLRLFQAAIRQAETQARIDELERLGNYKDQFDNRWDLSTTVEYRIAELQATLTSKDESK